MHCLSYLLTRWGSIHRCILYIQNNNRLHKNQTMRLSLLYTVSITFIIFSACLLHLQSHTLYTNIKSTVPSDIVISSNSMQDASFISFLQNDKNRPYIQQYEFIQTPVTSSVQFTSIAGYTVVTPSFYTLSPSYFDIMYIITSDSSIVIKR